MWVFGGAVAGQLPIMPFIGQGESDLAYRSHGPECRSCVTKAARRKYH
jgi:hypothetical protein